MSTVLVTGGSGVLGQPTVRSLLATGAQVRVLSRHALPTPLPGVTWVRGDLLTGEGLPTALQDIDAVIHAASLPAQPGADVQMTRQLIRAAQDARVPHTLYVSIVGIDRLAYSPYYAAKLQGEQLLAGSGLPHSVQRATQFHEFVAFLLGTLALGPVQVLPRGLRLQPVQVEAVAEVLARAALGAPGGRLHDVAGPDILGGAELARIWQTAVGRRLPTLHLPIPFPAMARALSSGQLVNADAARIGQSWAGWLGTHARDPNAYAPRGRVTPT